MSNTAQTKIAAITCPCCGETFSPRGNWRYCNRQSCHAERARRRLADWLAKPGKRERMRELQTAYRRREGQAPRGKRG